MSAVTINDRRFPPPGSEEEKKLFYRLQAKLADIYHRLAQNRREPHTTIVVPSLTLDPEELSKIEGTMYYEERLLCMLMLLRRPRTRIIFISSTKIHPIITQYYLSFLTGIPIGHAMRRLTMLDTNDASAKPLTQKILDSPWLMDRVRKLLGDPNRTHLVVFNTTPFERTLAVRLGIPVYGTDPDLHYLGSKSGCRRILKQAGIPVPDGYEDLKSRQDIVTALDNLWRAHPNLKRAVVKLNEGFSGKGNAMFDYRAIQEFRDAESAQVRKQAIEKNLFKLKFEAQTETWPNFERQFQKLQGVVEAFIEGEVKHSPSVQARVNAIGEPQVISTHDQIMGGPTGQMFLGCTFPARKSYRLQLQEDGRKVAEILSTKGVLGRFAVDFILVPTATGYERYAIEINLRRGGTTHPFAMMKFLIEGHYDEQKGLFVSSLGVPKYYLATDNLLDPKYQGMGPEDLIDVVAFNELHFHSYLQRGVAYHMIGALSQCGKLGITCIGDTRDETQALHQKTIEVLDNETTFEGRKPRLEFL